jgi:hypothetical protein
VIKLLRLLACSLVLAWGAPASANWLYTPGAGPSNFRSFNSGTTPAGTSACAATNTDCMAFVPIDITGTPLFSSGNPGVVSGGPFAVTGTFWQTTQPVSGTFWQATQPVSGTFWQATQPISAAALPLPTGAATQTTLAAVLSALASPFQAGGSIGNTTFGSTQSTSPWVIGGPAAAGAAPVGNPLFTGMFDGTDIRRVMGDETNGLWVNIKAGAGSGGTALADEATFTQGSTNTTPLGCFYTTSVTNLTTGQAGVARCTNDRQQMVADAAVLAQLVTLNNTATLPVPFPVNITPTDCSGTATGTAANAFTAGATKHGFFVSNRSTDPIWISFTGNAVVGGTASYLLPAGSSTVAGGSFSAPSGFGMNTALSVIGGGSSDAYTCTWY